MSDEVKSSEPPWVYTVAFIILTAGTYYFLAGRDSLTGSDDPSYYSFFILIYALLAIPIGLLMAWRHPFRGPINPQTGEYLYSIETARSDQVLAVMAFAAVLSAMYLLSALATLFKLDMSNSNNIVIALVLYFIILASFAWPGLIMHKYKLPDDPLKTEDPLKPFPRIYPVIYPMTWSAVAAGLKEPIFIGGKPKPWIPKKEDRENSEMEALFQHQVDIGAAKNFDATLKLTVKFTELESGTKIQFTWKDMGAFKDEKCIGEVAKLTMTHIDNVILQVLPPGEKIIVEVPPLKPDTEWGVSASKQMIGAGVILTVGIIVLFFDVVQGYGKWANSPPSDRKHTELNQAP